MCGYISMLALTRSQSFTLCRLLVSLHRLLQSFFADFVWSVIFLYTNDVVFIMQKCWCLSQVQSNGWCSFLACEWSREPNGVDVPLSSCPPVKSKRLVHWETNYAGNKSGNRVCTADCYKYIYLMKPITLCKRRKTVSQNLPSPGFCLLHLTLSALSMRAFRTLFCMSCPSVGLKRSVLMKNKGKAFRLSTCSAYQ